MFDLSINQIFKSDYKYKYGEINTPFFLIKEMLDLFPKKVFSDPNKKWLDPACGCGYFMMVLYNYLFNGLQNIIKDEKQREKHIIEKMLFMCEINEKNIIILKERFGSKANIFHIDFLSFQYKNKFDFIIGNPPYNSNGIKKVPTNKVINKKLNDGKTIWIDFIKYSITLLKQKGYLNMIIPSIWMKPDKANMNEFITKYKIHYLKTFTNTETNKIFKNQAQTPTCYFLLQKSLNKDNLINIYSDITNNYERYIIKKNIIPLCGYSIIDKLFTYVEKYGNLNVLKTNMPSKHNIIYESLEDISLKETSLNFYKNIKTCTLKSNQPQLVINYSLQPCAYYGMQKVILAHKMYGFPYYDKEGVYGISNRDNYVLLGYNERENNIINDFFKTKLALYLFETTKYRMKYLEKYVFKFIPNITKIDNFPENINDNTMREFFHFNNEEYEKIMNSHKDYNFDFIKN